MWTVYDFLRDKAAYRTRILDYSRIKKSSDVLFPKLYIPIYQRSRCGGEYDLEIPKDKPSSQLVYLQPLIESKAFTKQSSSGLAVVLGKDTRGEPVVFDLSESSHVFIHGRAGWESTVAIHEMLLSMLFRHTPENLRLIIIDTRIVEYVYFEGIPHLCQPLSDGLEEAMRSLSWAVSEIERREKLMRRLGVGSLSSLNEQLIRSCRREASRENRLNISQPLPNIVIVIDDFGDLVLLYDKKVKDLLSRIMKAGAAVGVHVILATQRMNEDVIPFSMKSYCRTILCFRHVVRQNPKRYWEKRAQKNYPGLTICSALSVACLFSVFKVQMFQ